MNKCLFPMLSEETLSLPFFIKCIGGWDNQEYISRLESGYADYQIFLCINGEGTLNVNGNEYSIKKNMGFFLSPNIPHEYYATKEPWEVRWIAFSGNSAASFLSLMELKEFSILELSEIQKLDRIHNEIFISAQSMNSMKALDCSGLLYRFLIDLRNCMASEQGKLNALRHKLQPVIAYIENNYDKKLILDEISDTIGTTPQHLCRLFRQAYNLRPFEYLTRFRILKSKELLAASNNHKITDIAKLVGYNDTSYFCTLFKNSEGMSPIEFKRMYRSSN